LITILNNILVYGNIVKIKMIGKKSKDKVILLIILVLLVVVNYGVIEGILEESFKDPDAILVHVDRVIDGDTIVVNGTSMRLLGINCPEKGQKYFEEAKEYLESLVMNKSIVVRKEGQDMYYRELVYLYDVEDKKNINLEIVRNGYANYYFPSGKDEYYKDFVKAWKRCMIDKINLCEPSNNECADCIELEEWGYNKDTIIYNMCDKNCNLERWSIKDEGRKLLIFEDTFILKPGQGAQITADAFGVTYVWTKTGDSIFIRDDEGKLVLFDSY
jgi:hypothetical protein